MPRGCARSSASRRIGEFGVVALLGVVDLVGAARRRRKPALLALGERAAQRLGFVSTWAMLRGLRQCREFGLALPVRGCRVAEREQGGDAQDRYAGLGVVQRHAM